MGSPRGPSGVFLEAARGGITRAGCLRWSSRASPVVQSAAKPSLTLRIYARLGKGVDFRILHFSGHARLDWVLRTLGRHDGLKRRLGAKLDRRLDPMGRIMGLFADPLTLARLEAPRALETVGDMLETERAAGTLNEERFWTGLMAALGANEQVVLTIDDR